MIPILVIGFAAVLGLAFGSFLNVCATRWPEEESIAKCRSHCRSCGRTLAWWENIPLLSWLALRGHCRTCKAWIGWRYPLAELAVGALWGFSTWHTFLEAPELSMGNFTYDASVCLADGIARIIFLWILVALAVIDVENLWLPDRLTIPGIALGCALAFARGGLCASMAFGGGFDEWRHYVALWEFYWFIGAVASAGGILVIRWIYMMIRGQEGIGMGDVKLMAMIGGWLGVRCAVLAFAIAVILGALFALSTLALPPAGTGNKPWRQQKLPFGAFLSIGAAVCAFWGVPLAAAYMSWAGF
ncbi:MAG TPA: prepilin peptidase [Terracidiphilus sp.]|nr:prepilin peptidase [Terracidiphilus sp.]